MAVTIELPVGIGDFVCSDKDDCLVRYKVYQIRIYEDNHAAFSAVSDSNKRIIFNTDDIGKTVHIPRPLTELLEEINTSKPQCELIGKDGNIFNLMSIAFRTLRKNGMDDKATEMWNKVTTEAQNYAQALAIIGEYVEIV